MEIRIKMTQEEAETLEDTLRRTVRDAKVRLICEEERISRGEADRLRAEYRVCERMRSALTEAAR